VEGVCGIGESRGHVTARLGKWKCGWNTMCAPFRTADRLRVAPAFMTIATPSVSAPAEYSPRTRTNKFLPRKDRLNLVLETGDSSV
jgi:hypothetical protein